MDSGIAGMTAPGQKQASILQQNGSCGFKKCERSFKPEAGICLETAHREAVDGKR
jgi:hypothetical protein